jgi:hypothetical protein
MEDLLIQFLRMNSRRPPLMAGQSRNHWGSPLLALPLPPHQALLFYILTIRHHRKRERPSYGQANGIYGIIRRAVES